MVLVILMTALLFSTGCGQSSDQSQALEEQQQKNEELQRELDAQKEKQEEAEQAAKQEQLEQQVADLEEKIEEKESEPQGTDQPEQSNSQPDAVIDSNSDWTAPPSRAAEGIVVVSSDYNVGAVTTEEAEVINAAIGYYQAAETGDYFTTHGLLSTADQALYPVDVWVEANTVLNSAAGEFVVSDAYPEDIGNGFPTYAVTLTIYSPDGSSSNRTTYFVNEGNGYWAHWLTEEEMDLFNGAL